MSMTFASDAKVLRHSVAKLLERANLEHAGLLDENEFIRILMHASCYRFGLAIEIAIEVIGEAISEGDGIINLDHFAAVYFVRTNGSDDMNPFVSENWKAIDATKAMTRWLDESKESRIQHRS